MSKLRIFKFRKFKSDFPRGKRVKIFLMEKPSPPLRNVVIFSKKMIKKQWFQQNPQKVQKYWKSKNGIKTALRPLFRELWANQEFSNLENLRAISPAENGSKISWWKSRLRPSETWWFFQKKWWKTMISAVKTLEKFKNIKSPKMVSKRLYGNYLRSYEQIKNFQI